MKVTVRVECEACGHTNETEVEIPDRPIVLSEPVEDAPLRGFRSLPIAEPLEDDE